MLAVLLLVSQAALGMGKGSSGERNKPIEDPFGDFQNSVDANQQPIVVRSKSAGRSMEISFPAPSRDTTDLVIPFSNFDGGSYRAPASVTGSGELDQSYQSKKPGVTDREILASMPKTMSGQDDAKRTQIEQSLGLRPTDPDSPDSDSSYLASIDRIKQLFKLGRFEPGLIELDGLLKMYPNNPKLYEMRGTLLDRLGYDDLAIKSWEQAVQLRPENDGLRRYVDRRKRQRGRGVAAK